MNQNQKDELWNWLIGKLDYRYSRTGTWTPAWTAPTANPSIGNGSLSGWYLLNGKRVQAVIALTWGSTTAGGTGAWSFSLPFKATSRHESAGLARLLDSGTRYYGYFAVIAASAQVVSSFPHLDATTGDTLTATVPMTWATGDTLLIQVEYEIE